VRLILPRGCDCRASRGAASFLTETVSRVRSAGATGPLTVRADWAFYSRSVLQPRAEDRCPVLGNVRQDRKVQAAIAGIDETAWAPIAGIDETAWAPIPYWLSSPEVSGADVAEIPFTCFSGRDSMPVRLIVRRVRPTPGSQLALFTMWDYHALVTDRDGEVLELEADHRRHAVVEQVIADLRSAGLAHLPSGRFGANAAWLAMTAMAHNLGRAVARLAGPDLATATSRTLRRTVCTVPGRLVRSGRRRRLRLPACWPWASAITTALRAIQKLRSARDVPPRPDRRDPEKPADRPDTHGTK
jgi:hypothetical protein